MHCISTGVELPCNDCKGCKGLFCNNCGFYDPNMGCSLSECNFKYSDVAKTTMKVAKQYGWD